MKKINFDAIVGLFVVAGFMAFVYMSLQLGEFSVFSMEKTYVLQAKFDNVSGLKRGALVELAGVNVGKVSNIALDKNDRALVQFQINNGVKITEGGYETLLVNDGMISETESAVDLEGLVSKYIFGKV